MKNFGFLLLLSVGCLFWIFLIGDIKIQAHGETVIIMRDDSFEPAEITIEKGDTVRFVNEGSEDRWPASNLHPTHRGYPGSDIDKCDQEDQKNKLFDSCEGVPPGESYAFTFEEVGEWRFHDHLFAQMKGKVIVVGEDDKAVGKRDENWFMKVKNSVAAFFERLFGINPQVERDAELIEWEKNYDPNVSAESEQIFSDKQELFSYVKKFGADKATQQLHNLSTTYGSCHDPAHDAGRIAYKLSGGDAFTTCSAECHSGCYHGATEAYFSEHGTENLMEDLNLLCSSELNSFFSHQCIHGIGHGLMAWSDYNIHEALANCDLLPEWKESCYSGVFMENVVGGLASEEGHYSEYLSEDPHMPCNVVEEKYVGACYFYQSSRMLHLALGDFSKVAEGCIEAGPMYQNICFESMGRDVGGVYRNNPEGAIAACNFAPIGDGRTNCLRGAVQDSFWDPSGESVALEFCGLLTLTEEQQACYDVVRFRAGEILDDDQFHEFCGKLPAEQENLCV
jgi:plastocyanin